MIDAADSGRDGRGRVTVFGSRAAAHLLGQFDVMDLGRESGCKIVYHRIGDKVCVRRFGIHKPAQPDALGGARRVGAAFLRYRDRNVTGTHAGHRVHDRAGHAVADGLDGNDRRNADDDAQHREQTAHFIASDAGQRHADILKKLHVRRSPFVRPRSGRRAASAPAGIPRPARGCA